MTVDPFVNPSIEYRQAIDLIRADQFSAASEKLQGLIASGYHDPTVYHALGNSLYRQEQWGEAYGAYLQGLYLSPRHQDLQYNVTLLSEQLQISPPIIASVTFDEGCILTSVFASLMFLSLLLRRWHSRRLLSIGLSIPMILALGLTIDTWLQQDTGVIIKEGYVRSRLEKGVDLFSIGMGEHVTLLEKDTDYWLVEHSDFGKGWISTDMVVPYVPGEMK